MSNFLMPIKLQMFADDFDLEAFRAEFEADYQEPEVDDQEEVEVIDGEPEVEETEDDLEAEPEGEEELPEADTDVEPGEDPELDADPDPEPAPKKQSREENAAFAQMRKELEAEKRKAALAEQVAAQYGMSVEQFEQAYKEQQDKARAEQQGIPVEMLRRMEAAEQQLAQQKLQAEQDKFWGSVTNVKDKYGLQDDEVKNVFEFIGREGLVNNSTGLPLIDFDKAYKLANFDKLQERKEKEAHQKRLAEKKARQRKSAVPPANASTATNSELDEITDEFVEKRLRERGLL